MNTSFTISHKKKLFNHINKIFTMNIFSIIIFICINYHFVSAWGRMINLNQSFNAYFNLRVYACIIVNILIMITIFEQTRRYKHTLKDLIEDKYDFFIISNIVLIKNILIFCSIPIFYFLFYFFKVNKVSYLIWSQFFLNLIFNWIFPLLFVTIFISFINTICTNNILKYIIGILIIYFTSIKMLLFSFTTDNKHLKLLLNTLNVYSDQSYVSYSDSIGMVLDSLFFIDKVIPILFLLFLISISKIIFKNKSNKKQLFRISSYYIIINIILVIYSINSYTYALDNYDYIDNLSQISKDIEIKSYEIDVDLGNKTKINSKVLISNLNNSESNDIRLLLDNLFKINYVKINNQNIGFSHKDNILTIKLGESFNYDNLTLEVNYSGRVNILKWSNEYKIVSNDSQLILPPNSFAWYPSIKSIQDKDFTIKVKSKNTIYSNLNQVSRINGLFKNTFKFTGTDKDIGLFSGNYKKYNFNNIEVICPEEISYEDQIENFMDYLETTKNLNENIINLNKQVLDEYNNKNIKKIIIAPLEDYNYEYFDDIEGTEVINPIYYWFSNDILFIKLNPVV